MNRILVYIAILISLFGFTGSMSAQNISFLGIRGLDGRMTRELAPGMFVTLEGRGFPVQTARAAEALQVGIEVGADRHPATILWITDRQIRFQVPTGISVAEPGKFLQDEVWFVLYQGTTKSSYRMGWWFMVPAKPTLLANPVTLKPIGFNQYTSPTGLNWAVTSPANPAVGQDGYAFVVPFTGTGPVDKDGKLLAGADIRVLLDGQSVPSGTLLGAFAMPQFPGLGQFNLLFAPGISSGWHGISIIIDGNPLEAVEEFFP